MTEVLHRSFTTDLELDDASKRLVIGRCVPYNVVATVGPDAWNPQGPYKECFEHGVFKRASRAPFRVALGFQHETGVNNLLGHAVDLDEREDGCWGQFKVTPGMIGDHALELVKAKVLRAFSVGFVPLDRPARYLPDGTVVRSKAALDEVSLCREGAYRGADVMAVRKRVATQRQWVLGHEAAAAEQARLDRLRALGYLQ